MTKFTSPEEAPRKPQQVVALPKISTHIEGLDKVLHGGFPAERTTLVWGGPGCGKSVLGLEFLYRGALAGDPGILVLFEEQAQAVRQNAHTFGWDLAPLEQAGKFFLLDGHPDPRAVHAGDFELTALLAILGGQAQALGARKIVIDAVDVLTRTLNDPRRERAELYALHQWLLEQRMTAILTMKTLQERELSSHYEFLDFMADCVIKLDQRVSEQVNTRRLQVLKYRGSNFSRNEYPYIITEEGIALLPISSIPLVRGPHEEIIPSGNPRFDTLLGGGYKCGSSVLISGVPGVGKTTLAGTTVQATCARGEKALFITFEESEGNVVANLGMIGLDLRPALQAGTLRFLSRMSEAIGAEEHLFEAIRIITAFQPHLVVVDALSSTLRMGTSQASFEYAVRLLNVCKERGITCLLTYQAGEESNELAGVSITSLIDTIVLLRFVERDSALHRTLLVRKARGAASSLQIHEFRLTGQGIEVLGPSGSSDRGRPRVPRRRRKAKGERRAQSASHRER